jgi:CRP-like cAMP-binding protein
MQRRRSFSAGQDLVYQGQPEQAAYILVSGWVCSYKTQPDGTRQIIDFQIPGDFLGLRSVLLRASDHSFEPITDMGGLPSNSAPPVHQIEAAVTTPGVACVVQVGICRQRNFQTGVVALLITALASPARTGGTLIEISVFR